MSDYYDRLRAGEKDWDISEDYFSGNYAIDKTGDFVYTPVVQSKLERKMESEGSSIDLEETQ